MITKDSWVRDIPFYNSKKKRNIPNQLYRGNNRILWMDTDGINRHHVVSVDSKDQTVQEVIDANNAAGQQNTFKDPPLPCFDRHEIVKLGKQVEKSRLERKAQEYQSAKTRLEESGEW